jgi:uncharacterized membrane protein
MPETINGLPLHPLVVHAPVVLIPMVLIVTILVVVRQGWRRSLGWWAVLLAAVAVIATFAAARTGESLAEVVGEPLRHASLGEGLPYLATAMLVMLTLYVASGSLWDWRTRVTASRQPLTQGAVAAESVLPATPRATIEDPSVAESSSVPEQSSASAPRKRPRKVPLALTVLGVLAIVVSALVTLQTFRVGESGAQAVWAAEYADARDGRATEAAAEAGTVIPMSEVIRHATGADCWTVIDGTVYDLTEWVRAHPGGVTPILTLCGTDGTSSFATQHAGDAKPQAELAEFALGTVR